jgi:glycosyl transferase family 25
MIFDQFDRIRIINLVHRTDRRREMEHELAKVGLVNDPRVAFFPAVKSTQSAPFNSSGARGCFLSHLKVLQEAAEAGERLLILEDDCDFLPEISDYQPQGEWDVFYGGYHANDPANPHDSDIIGSHFMGFSAPAVKAAAAFLTAHLDLDTPPDPRAAAEPGFDPTTKPSVDGAYVWFRRSRPDLPTVFSQIAAQRASRTDIGYQKWFDRYPIIRDLAGFARRLRGRRSTANYVFD